MRCLLWAVAVPLQRIRSVKSTLDNKLHPAIDRKVAQLHQLNPRARASRASGGHGGGGGGGSSGGGSGGRDRDHSDGDGGDDDSGDDGALEADLREQLRLNAELKARLQSMEGAGA